MPYHLSSINKHFSLFGVGHVQVDFHFEILSIEHPKYLHTLGNSRYFA